MTRRKLLQSIVFAFLPGVSQLDSSGPSLMELKLELAKDAKPYLHLTPEGIFVYFKTILLKNLKVLRIEPEPQGVLKVSRVVGWAPPISRPTIHSDSKPVDYLNILEVDDMPDSFVVLFDDGQVWTINPIETSSPISGYEEILNRLKEIDESLYKLDAELVTQIFLEETQARELYWILQEDLAAIN